MTAVGDVATSVADRYPTRLTEGEPTPFPRVDPVVWGSAPGPVTADDVEGYDRDGFLAIEQLVPPAEAAELLTEAHQLAGDPRGHDDERWVREPGSDEVRSVFEVHRISERFAALVADVRLAGIARQLLGSDVAIHQSRINLKPGFGGKEFDWHSDFETWHAEDGLPAMRTASISLALTPNLESNGPLMIIPGSHRTFIPCLGETPDAHYRESLRRQEVGVPDHDVIAALAGQSGIRVLTGAAGSATVFDSNCLHGSNSNISPYPRSNVFVVYNSVENPLAPPFAASQPRPTFIADRDPVVV
jgi:ectoine hydroxylase